MTQGTADIFSHFDSEKFPFIIMHSSETRPPKARQSNNEPIEQRLQRANIQQFKFSSESNTTLIFSNFKKGSIKSKALKTELQRT